MSSLNSSSQRAMAPSAEQRRARVSRAVSTTPQRILVCADGSSSSGDALEVARSLARRRGAHVELLTVFAPRIPLPNDEEREGAARCERCDRRAAAELVRAVRAETRRRFGGRALWPVRLEVGSPPREIVDRAKCADVDLIVLGLGGFAAPPHRRGQSTTLCVSRYTEVPMLAVAPEARGLSRVAVVLVDQQMPHVPTIRALMQCMEDAALVWVLLYAGPRARSTEGVTHDRATIARVLEVVRREAALVSPRIVVRGLYRAGDPLDALLSVVGAVSADLVAAPVHGDPGTLRHFLPNVAEPLLVAAPCSVLVAPDAR